MSTKNYQATLATARRAARRMLDAEMELGSAAAAVGIERADQLARDLGVRKSVVVAAVHRAAGLVKRHRELERLPPETSRRARP